MAHIATATGIAAHIAVIDGQPTTTTQDIAEVYGKQHAKVLAIVRQRMVEAGEWGVANFGETPYTNPQNGQTYTVIRMTKKGFHFVVGKFTGTKAVAHQIAFADEFERMETALRDSVNIHATAHQPAALPYERISPAQAQDLKELVYQVVQAGAQGFGETWRRLHNKFRVNSYLELPAARFAEARAYLLGKLPANETAPAPNTAPAAQPMPSPERLKAMADHFIQAALHINAAANCQRVAQGGVGAALWTNPPIIKTTAGLQ